jgi:hypothetical protein
MGQHNQNQSAKPQGQQRKGPAALALSCISASAAELATYPIDAVKTQLQLKQSTSASSIGSSTKPTGALQLARQLVQGNGLSGLYAGLTPAVLRHFIYTGVQILVVSACVFHKPVARQRYPAHRWPCCCLRTARIVPGLLLRPILEHRCAGITYTHNSTCSLHSANSSTF